MARPQQPEIARSQTAPVDPDALDPAAETQGQLAPGGRVGGVPTDNQPGHHPDHDQDKPDGAAFLAKMRGEGRAAGDDVERPSPEATAGEAEAPDGGGVEALSGEVEAPSGEAAGAPPALVAEGPDPAAPAPGEPVGAAPADLVDADADADAEAQARADLAAKAGHLAGEGAQLARKGVEEGAELLRKGLGAVKHRR